MKKKLLLGMSFLAVAAASAGTTFAVLSTQTETLTNTTTMGNISVRQFEMERVIDKNGDFVSTGVTDRYGFVPDKLQEYTQDKLLMPTSKDPYPSWDKRQNGKHHQSWVNVEGLKEGYNQLFEGGANVIDKFVFVQNTGNQNLYYRTVIALESPKESNAGLNVNLNGNALFDWDQTTPGSQNGENVEMIKDIEIDNVNYTVIVATYTTTLKPNETSRPSLLQVYLDHDATMKDVNAFGNKADILVVTQAVQADGFDDAQEALESAYGKIDSTADFDKIFKK